MAMDTLLVSIDAAAPVEVVLGASERVKCLLIDNILGAADIKIRVGSNSLSKERRVLAGNQEALRHFSDFGNAGAPSVWTGNTGIWIWAASGSWDVPIIKQP